MKEVKEDCVGKDIYMDGRNPEIDKYSSDAERLGAVPVKGIKGGNHLLEAAQDKMFNSLIESLEAIEIKLRVWTAEQLQKTMPNADPCALAKFISGSIADELHTLLNTEAKKNPMVSAWNELVESCNGGCGNCVIRYVCPSTQAEFVDFAGADRVKDGF
jgi:hypothetical protein